MPNYSAIKILAQRCAAANLKMRDANVLFYALYVADALALAKGNRSRAAIIAGVNREALIRYNQRAEREATT